MTNASAKYVIAAEDRTKAAADSIKRNFKDIDGAARKIAGTLKGLGVVGIALKAWATAARLGDEAIKNLAASNKAFADSVRESETAMRSAFSAGQLTIEAQTKLTAAFNDPAYVAAMRQSADLFGRLRLEMKALGPAWGIVIGKAAQWAGLVDKLSQLDSRGPLSRRAPLRDLGDVGAAQKLGKGRAAVADKPVSSALASLKANDDFAEGLRASMNDAYDAIAEGYDAEAARHLEHFVEPVIKNLELIPEAALASFKEFGSYADEGMRGIQRSFANFFIDPAQEGIKGLGRSVVDTLRESFANILAAKAASGLFGSMDSGGKLSGGLLSAGINSLFGFASGGSFNVGGSGGTDSQLVAFRATPRERVTVETPGQQKGRALVIHNSPVIHVNAAQLTQDQAARMVADSQRRMWDELDRRYGIA